MAELTLRSESTQPRFGLIASGGPAQAPRSPGSRGSNDGSGSNQGNGAPRRHRLVVAVFDTLVAVGDVLGELADAGYLRDQLCLLCAGVHVDAIDALSQRGPTLGWLADRGGRTFVPSGHVVITSSAVMAEIAALLSSSAEESGPGDALPPLVHRAELRQHLAGRAVVLIVDSGNLDRQQVCTRILMRRTRHAVQTHQVARGRN